MQCANSAAFRLWMCLMVFLFKEKFKTQTLKSSKQMYLFLPNFTSEISYLSHLRQINWPLVSDRVVYCIENTILDWNGVVPGYNV